MADSISTAKKTNIRHRKKKNTERTKAKNTGLSEKYRQKAAKKEKQRQQDQGKQQKQKPEQQQKQPEKPTTAVIPVDDDDERGSWCALSKQIQMWSDICCGGGGGASGVGGEKTEKTNFASSIASLKDTAVMSHRLAKETIQLCETTRTQCREMQNHCKNVSTTLTANSKGNRINVDAFDTIHALLSGKKVKTCLQLAKSIQSCSVLCVRKSIEMTTLMNKAVDTLPEPIQKALDRAMLNRDINDLNANDDEQTIAEQDDEDDDDDEDKEDNNDNDTDKAIPDKPSNRLHDRKAASMQLTTLDNDLEDIQDCIDAIKNLHLYSALEIGVIILEQFAYKAHVCRELVQSIQNFAQDVCRVFDTSSFHFSFSSLADAKTSIQSLELGAIVNRVKDIWTCLRTSALMKRLAEGVGKLVKLLITLFKATISKVAGLWKALSYAKECIQQCIGHVHQTKTLCYSAIVKSVSLVKQAKFITTKLSQKGIRNGHQAGALLAILMNEFLNGSEIKNALGIANEMHDLIVQCSDMTIFMVDRVKSGYDNLPPMLTNGIAEEEKEENDETVTDNKKENGDKKDRGIVVDNDDGQKDKSNVKSSDMNNGEKGEDKTDANVANDNDGEKEKEGDDKEGKKVEDDKNTINESATDNDDKKEDTNVVDNESANDNNEDKEKENKDNDDNKSTSNQEQKQEINKNEEQKQEENSNDQEQKQENKKNDKSRELPTIMEQPEGKKKKESPVVIVGRGVVDLERCRVAIHNSDRDLQLVESSRRGFHHISEKILTAKHLLVAIQDYSEECSVVIESFLNVWDISIAKDKIRELHSMVKVSEQMKEHALLIKRLLVGVIALMKSSVDKFQLISFDKR